MYNTHKGQATNFHHALSHAGIDPGNQSGACAVCQLAEKRDMVVESLLLSYANVAVIIAARNVKVAEPKLDMVIMGRVESRCIVGCLCKPHCIRASNLVTHGCHPCPSIGAGIAAIYRS